MLIFSVRAYLFVQKRAQLLLLSYPKPQLETISLLSGQGRYKLENEKERRIHESQ